MRKPKILLIMPPYNFRFAKDAIGSSLPAPPLGPALLRNYLKKQGWNARIKDLDIEILRNKKILDKMLILDKKINKANIKNYLKNIDTDPSVEKTAETLLGLINVQGFDIFGFSIAENCCLKYSLILAKKIKEIKKQAGVVFGGIFVSESLFFPIDGVVDLVIRGSGEEKLIEFCSKYPEIFKKNSATVTRFKNYNLTLSQKPDYDNVLSLYKNIPNNYGVHNYTNNVVIPYLYSCGCSWGKCSYCDESFHPSVFFEKPFYKIIEDLECLKKKYKSPYFAIYNKHLNADNKSLKKLCRLLIKSELNLTMSGYLKVNIRPSLIVLMAQAGFKVAFCGIESYNQKILKLMKREGGVTKKACQESVDKLAENKIFQRAYFLIGFPTETEEEFKTTFYFLQKNINKINSITTQVFSLYNCYVKKCPEKFGIRIRKRSLLNSSTVGGVYPYDEITGRPWEKIIAENYIKQEALKTLFFLYKEIPSIFYFRSPNETLGLMRKYNDPQKVENEFKKIYENFRKRTSFYLKINENGGFNFKPPLEERWSEEAYSLSKILKTIEREGKRKDKLILTGEPTYSKNLFQIVRFAKNAGFKDIDLLTNGLKLANPSYAQKLYKNGCHCVDFYLFGHKASLHDKITGNKGDFRRAFNAIENWQRVGGEFRIKIVLHQLNKPYLYEIIKGSLIYCCKNKKMGGTKEKEIDILGGAMTFLKN